MSRSKVVWVDALHLKLYDVNVPGWYAFDQSDKAVMGPYLSREECDYEIAGFVAGPSSTAANSEPARRSPLQPSPPVPVRYRGIERRRVLSVGMLDGRVKTTPFSDQKNRTSSEEP